LENPVIYAWQGTKISQGQSTVSRFLLDTVILKCRLSAGFRRCSSSASPLHQQPLLVRCIVALIRPDKSRNACPRQQAFVSLCNLFSDPVRFFIVNHTADLECLASDVTEFHVQVWPAWQVVHE